MQPPDDYAALASTLAQVTATLIALLLGFASAYYLFIRDRAASLEEQKVREQLAISEMLARLSEEWPLVLWVIPFDAIRRYREERPGVREADFVAELVTDFLFQRTAFLRFRHGLPEVGEYAGPAAGRFYIWLVYEAVRVLTAGSATKEHAKPEGVFPTDVRGPGFDEWRRGYERMAEALKFLRSQREPLLNDLRAYFSGHEPSDWHTRYMQTLLDAESVFVKTMDLIRERLSEIDRVTVVRERYSLERGVRWPLFLGLLGISAVAGVLLPLLYLAMPVVYAPVWLRLTVTLAAILGLSAVVVESARAATLLVSERPAYVRRRWLDLMARELGRQRPVMDEGTVIELEPFEAAVSSPEQAEFTSAVRSALTSFVELARVYNRAVEALNACVLHDIDAERSLSEETTPSPDGSFTLLPAMFAQTRRFSLWLENYRREPKSISLETRWGTWTRVERMIGAPRSQDGAEILRDALIATQVRVEVDPACIAYRTSRTALTAAAGRLRDVLGEKDRPSAASERRSA